MKSKLTQARLKEVLHYDPETGIFTWVKQTSRRIRVGRVAGYKNKDGYIAIKVLGELHGAHRLAFLYMEGYLPEHRVDHKHGICDDNRWSELRHVGTRCNAQNGCISKNNASGFNGVSWDKSKNKWAASATVDRSHIHLGRYDDILDAALARITFEDWCPKWHCDERNINRQKVMAALRGEDTDALSM